MLPNIASQIAKLLNERNKLTRWYTEDIILENAENYVLEMEEENVIGFVEIKKVQWYQVEICHLTVADGYEGKGIGRRLIERALRAAREKGARIVQCTIRDDNHASKRIFQASGFSKVSDFFNVQSVNNIVVFQRVIHPAR